MSDAISTLSVPLTWAAKEKRRDDILETGFFLFREGEGRVVLRKPSDEYESPAPTSWLNEPEPTEKRSVPDNKAARVPQTRVLLSHADQRFILLKKYEGFVTARHEDSFSTRLFENASDYPVVEAEFDLQELSERDRELAVEGAPLVWTIGYAYDGSTRKRESTIYLRRLPPWNDRELEQSRRTVEDLTSAIRWE